MSFQVARNPRPTFVTALPVGADGQEVYYRADSSNGIIWHLRFRSTASGGNATYPWEFVGGSQLSALQTADNTTITSTTYVTDANAPAITLPLAGDYLVTFSSSAVDNSVTNQQVFMTAATGIPSNAVGDALSARKRDDFFTGLSRTIRLTALAASASLATYGRVNANTGRMFDRSLLAQPIRVG